MRPPSLAPPSPRELLRSEWVSSSTTALFPLSLAKRKALSDHGPLPKRRPGHTQRASAAASFVKSCPLPCLLCSLEFTPLPPFVSSRSDASQPHCDHGTAPTMCIEAHPNVQVHIRTISRLRIDSRVTHARRLNFGRHVVQVGVCRRRRPPTSRFYSRLCKMLDRMQGSNTPHEAGGISPSDLCGIAWRYA